MSLFLSKSAMRLFLLVHVSKKSLAESKHKYQFDPSWYISDLSHLIAQGTKYSKIRQVSGSLQKAFGGGSRPLGPKNYQEQRCCQVGS